MDKIQDSHDAAAAVEWFNARWQPGNWLAILSGEEIPPFVTGWSRTLANMFQIAFTPEIEGRLAAGSLGNRFFLRLAQWLQPPGKRPLVRLNNEVLGVMRLRRDAPLPEGGALTYADLERAELFDLREEELDCGHFTAWFTTTGWSCAFDFRSGRAKTLNFTACAKEFLAAARFCVEQGHARAATDNLFSACELLSKATLMLHHSPEAKAKTHRSLGSAINAWGKLGNIEVEFVSLFNRMSNSRAGARYEAASNLLGPELEDIDLVASLVERLELEVVPYAWREAPSRVSEPPHR